MSSSRRSIIKSTDRRSLPKKRLSFAPSPQKKKTAGDQNNDSQFGSILDPSDLSCKMTSFGMCYDRKAIPRTKHTQHDTIPMKECLRNNFTSALNFSSRSGTTANVLIVGEKFLGEKLKAYVLEMHHKQHTAQHLNWRIDLDIKCEKTLTPAMTPTAHFIIFLFMMETHESMMHLSKILRSFSDTLPNKRIMVVTVSSAQGCFKNVVDLEQLHMLLSSYQLIHFPWKEQGRLGQIELKKILELLYKSIGYHRGASLLMDYTMQLTMDWCIEDIGAQDSATSLI